MITALHALIYSDDAPKTRAFLRDVLGWSHILPGESEDSWLIFKSGPSEVGVHPTSGMWEGQPYSSPLHHSLSLMCDDLEATIAELKARGAEFRGEVQNQGFGLTILMAVPGSLDMILYQPRHELAYNLED